jgi:hypothetical protein
LNIEKATKIGVGNSGHGSEQAQTYGVYSDSSLKQQSMGKHVGNANFI